jgi:hypothetical protein
MAPLQDWLSINLADSYRVPKRVEQIISELREVITAAVKVSDTVSIEAMHAHRPVLCTLQQSIGQEH